MVWGKLPEGWLHGRAIYASVPAPSSEGPTLALTLFSHCLEIHNSVWPRGSAFVLSFHWKGAFSAPRLAPGPTS